MSFLVTVERKNMKKLLKKREYELICKVRIRGLRPLLHHNPAGVIVQGPSKGTKVYLPEEEVRKALYLGSDEKPYQPAGHLEGAMVKAAVQHKYAGKKTYKDLFNSRIWVTPEEIPLGGDWVTDARGAIVNRSRITRWRPRWDNWELEFEVHSDDPEIQPLIIKEVFGTAGRIGIGDFRPKYGIFEVVSFDIIQES